MQRNILGILVFVSVLFLNNISFGVVITGSSTAPTQAELYDSGMTYAYSVGRAINTKYASPQLRGGAVYIGESAGTGWCLAAYHLTTIDKGIQTVVFNENGTDVSYSITQAIQLSYDGTAADLCLLKLSGTPDVDYFDWRDLASSEPLSGNSTVTIVGCGRTRQNTPGTTYYTVNSSSYSQPTTYGQNKVDSLTQVTSVGGTSICYTSDWDKTGGISYYEGAYTNGDSGGGMFYYNNTTSSWSLVGINVATDASSNTEIYFSQKNYAVDLSYYVNDIAKYIPEPATVTLLMLGGATLLRRRSK